MAERLGYGLQIRPQRFNSASHLQSAQETPSKRGLLVFIVANAETFLMANTATFSHLGLEGDGGGVVEYAPKEKTDESDT